MALLFTILLGLSTAILAYFIYTYSQQSFMRETEVAIDAEIASIVEWVQLTDNSDIREIIAHRQAHRKHHHYLLINKDGEKIAGDLDALPQEAERLTEGVILFFAQENRNAAKIHTLESGDQLLVARDISELSLLHEQRQLLSGLVILFMFIVIFVSFAISAFVVSRINRIAATAQNIIDTGDLSQRVPIDSDWDDLSNLAKVLNQFLRKIEELMSSVRTVSDNIAHDLRTPLTRLKYKLDQLDGEASTELASEADQMLATFNALLRIANIEAGRQENEFKAIDLSVVLNDVVELYEPLCDEKQINIHFSPTSFELEGDRNLLFQAFANILDNAVKFTPKKGDIRIEMDANRQIVISDNGPGVAEEERERVFNRLYRGESSRTSPGAGLGLSLVAAVVQLHNGSIELEDAKPGLSVTLKL